MTSAERAAIDSFYRAFAAADLALLEQAATPDWEDIPLAPGQAAGPAGLIAIAADFARAFPDMAIAVEEVLEGLGRAAVRATLTGTHRGTFFGVAATGRSVRVSIHEFHEFRDGRIARTRHLEDLFGLLVRLGAWPPAMPAPHPEAA